MDRKESYRNTAHKWRSENPERAKEIKEQYYNKNRETILAKQKTYNLMNQNVHRKRTLKKFGITLDDYCKMLEDQNGQCAICGTNRQPKKALCVDHDHDTGEIRGLLCMKCNVALGLMDNNIESLQNAINYLRKLKDW